MSAAIGDRSGQLQAYHAGHNWDEMVTAEADVRPHWRGLNAVTDLLGPDGLRRRRDDVSRLLEDDGVTYRVLGSDLEQSWSLDPVPLLVEGAEWAVLEPALVQRTELLDAILTDLYGDRELIRRGLLPPELVFGHDGFIRAWDQIRVPGPRQLFLAACDVARDGAGAWHALGDRTQAPSGAGYAMENRRVVSRVLPGLYRDAQIHRLGPFFHAMRLALQEVAPTTSEAPRVVLLTPGAQSETAFDQSYLSSLLGYPVVEGSDLVVRDGRLWARSIGRLEPVDVVLRRVDAWFCDPLELRSDSQLGVPGLIEAARLGNVSVVNGLGTGVLENPALLPHLPAICQALRGEDLALPSVQTWWCGDPIGRQHVLSQLENLVVKPTARGSDARGMYGWELSAGERESVARRIQAEPHAWVGQARLALSTVPTVTDDGLEPRSLVLRSFAVASAGTYQVMAGGLARVAASRDTITVSNQAGALAKDVWVTSITAAAEPWVQDGVRYERITAAVSPRVAQDMFWLGRYAERAEDTARSVRAVHDRWSDFHRGVEPAGTAALAVLLAALTRVTCTWPGFAGADRMAEARSELLSLVIDDTRAGTVAYALRRLTESATAVRDQLSSDTWQVLNTLDRAIDHLARQSGAATRAGTLIDPDLVGTLARVIEGLLALAGLVAESMVRDTGWRFLDCGRRLERAQHITDLLALTVATRRDPAVDSLVLESVLISAESIITYRRRYHARAGVDTVLDLLLVDRDNPRSVLHQLDRLAEDLRQIPGEGDRREALDRQLRDCTARLLEVDTAALARNIDGQEREELQQFLSDLGRQLRGLSTAVELAHFAVRAPQRQFDSVDSTADLELM